MIRIFTTLLIYSIFALTLRAQVSPNIRINQVGFYPEGEKIAAVITSTSKAFSVKSVSDNSVALSGTLSAPVFWNQSDENVAIADFSALAAPGNYYLEVEGVGKSYDFSISDRAHLGVARASVKAYYFNRASIALTEQYAGKWKREAGHPDDQVSIHPSAATVQRPANSKISSSKGWYDAGDYNKYIVNSGITTYTLLSAYQHFPELYNSLNLNIPESGNAIPDILDETLWNLRWLISMQDPNDGGVYHKLTNANFDGETMPAKSTTARYVVQKTTAASLNFAAVLAQSYRVYKVFAPDFADSCLNAAKKAYEWAKANNAVYYNQNNLNTLYNPDVFTGEYGDNDVKDEFNWAAIELYISTKDDSYYSQHTLDFNGWFGTPGWSYVSPLPLVSLSFHKNELTDLGKQDSAKVKSALIKMADENLAKKQSTPYRFSTDQFYWGSNSSVGNQAVILLIAYKLTKNTAYLNATNANLDYILGRNATGYSFVTGIGKKPPVDIHHRQSKADGVAEPVPGFVAGGPNPGQEDKCTGYLSSKPARSYVDSWCSYASNEIAINWNAPLVFIAGGLEYYFEKSDFANLNPKPAAPVALVAEAKGMSKIDISWQTGNQEINVLILERSEGDEQHFEKIVELSASSTTYSNTALKSSTTYYYRLKSIGAFGESDYSEVVFATTTEDPTTGIEDEILSKKLLVTPNPSEGKLFLKFEEAKSLTVEVLIYDLQGRKIKAYNLLKKSSEYSLDTDLRNGLYIVMVKRGSESFNPRKIQFK